MKQRMNIFKSMNTRWPREELNTWTTVKRTAYILLPVLIYFAVHDMAEILLWTLLEVFMRNSSRQIILFLNENAYTINGIINGLTILIGVAVIGKAVGAEVSGQEAGEAKDKTSAESGTKAECAAEAGKKVKIRITGKKLTDYMILAALAFCAAGGLNLALYILGVTGSSGSYNQVAQLQYGVDFIIGLVLYGVVSPFAEEAVFRGLIYNRMKRCFHGWIALIFSSLLFGCYHGNLVQAVYGTLLGLLIAYTYEKYNSFAAPVLFHGVANISIYAMTYHGGFAAMEKNKAAMAGGIMLLTAAGLLTFIRKTVKKSDN